MSIKLVPQDIHLLAIKWADPDHLLLSESIGPQAWHNKYQERLELTIAEWLAKSLVAYQEPQRRIDAFVPVSHLVGTSRDLISYINSLVKIADELENIQDPNYRSHPNEAHPEDDFVLLGECFANGIARAAEIIACQLGDDNSKNEHCFKALLDTLNLIQMVKPDNAGSALYTTWTELNGKARNQFYDMTIKYPWVIEHAFILACYPICNIASGNEVLSILDAIHGLIKSGSPPAILKYDLEACLDAISIGKRILVRELSNHIFIPNDNNYLPTLIYNPLIVRSRYQYPEVDNCYAR